MALICLALTVTIVATFTVEERPSIETTDAAGNTSTTHLGHGQPHPEFGTLLVGGPGAERVDAVFGLAVLFGALQIALFVCCMLLGVRRNGRTGPAGRFIVAGGVVYLLAYAGLMYAYRGYIEGGSLEAFWSFPEPTAWMLYALAPAPLLFLLIFVLGFRRFIWDEDSEQALKQIVADKRAADGID
jgi:hypothetical protein